MSEKNFQSRISNTESAEENLSADVSERKIPKRKNGKRIAEWMAHGFEFDPTTLSTYPSEIQQEIADHLIEQGKSIDFLRSIDRFKDIKQKTLLKALDGAYKQGKPYASGIYYDELVDNEQELKDILSGLNLGAVSGLNTKAAEALSHFKFRHSHSSGYEGDRLERFKIVSNNLSYFKHIDANLYLELFVFIDELRTNNFDTLMVSEEIASSFIQNINKFDDLNKEHFWKTAECNRVRGYESGKILLQHLADFQIIPNEHFVKEFVQSIGDQKIQYIPINSLDGLPENLLIECLKTDKIVEFITEGILHAEGRGGHSANWLFEKLSLHNKKYLSDINFLSSFDFHTQADNANLIPEHIQRQLISTMLEESMVMTGELGLILRFKNLGGEIFYQFFAHGHPWLALDNFDKFSGIEQETADKCYRLLFTTTTAEYAQYIGRLYSKTGIAPSEDVTRHLLDVSDFHAVAHLPISENLLEEHFSKDASRNLNEYVRVGELFDCKKFYERKLGDIGGGDDLNDKINTVFILGALGCGSIKKEEEYLKIKTDITGRISDDAPEINDAISACFAEFVQRGDQSILKDCRDIYSQRKNLDVVTTLSGKEAVYVSLAKAVDSDDLNNSLLSLIFYRSTPEHLKEDIILNLSSKRFFFPENVVKWIDANPKDYQSLAPVHAVYNIASADIRRKSKNLMNDAYSSLLLRNESLQELTTQFPSIPLNIFLQLYAFSEGDRELLGQFENVYQQTKKIVQKEDILFGVVNSMNAHSDLLNNLRVFLKKADFSLEFSQTSLGKVFKDILIIDELFRPLQDDDYFSSSSEDVYSIPKDILEIFQGCDSVNELSTELRSIILSQVSRLFPGEKISSQKIEGLWREWGSLQPLFIYASKMSGYSGMREYLSEMVVHMDPPNYENWKEWRYDAKDPQVQSQIGHLSQRQLDVWKQDHFSELGVITVDESSREKPKKIQQSLISAIREGHLYNPTINSSEKYKKVNDMLVDTVENYSEGEDQFIGLVQRRIEELNQSSQSLNVIIAHKTSEKIKNNLTSLENQSELPVKSQTKNLLSQIGTCLSKQEYDLVTSIYKEAEKNGEKTISSELLFPQSIRVAIKQTLEDTEKKYENEMQYMDRLESVGLDKTVLENPSLLFSKRQELNVITQILRLLTLNSNNIAKDRIADNAEVTETPTETIESLKRYFKDSQAFHQDLENILYVIHEKKELSTQRRLGMIITDNPQMLLQIGKYPVGCGSCQNYEGAPEWNKALGGYVGDAHVKGMFLVDLNKLPQEVRTEINEKGFETVKNKIPPQNILEASIARSIVKIVKTQSNEPLLFIEPTYSSVNKADVGMDKYFNIFLEGIVTDQCGIKLTRGGGKEVVIVPATSNPGGQYEDGAFGAAHHVGIGIQHDSYSMPARMIDRFSPVTAEDRMLAEHVSGSMGYAHVLGKTA